MTSRGSGPELATGRAGAAVAASAAAEACADARADALDTALDAPSTTFCGPERTCACAGADAGAGADADAGTWAAAALAPAAGAGAGVGVGVGAGAIPQSSSLSKSTIPAGKHAWASLARLAARLLSGGEAGAASASAPPERRGWEVGTYVNANYDNLRNYLCHKILLLEFKF